MKGKVGVQGSGPRWEPVAIRGNLLTTKCHKHEGKISLAS